MRRFVLVLACLVCCTAARRLDWGRTSPWGQDVRRTQDIKYDIERNIHGVPDLTKRQRFLMDVLLQVQKPVVNAELLEMGKELIQDSVHYKVPMDDILMDFIEKCREHRLVGRNEVFNDLVVEHARQLVGLYKFLVLPNTWSIFQRNVCFARLRMNSVIFVNALQLAVRDRPDCQDLVMPAMNEVLPHLFYDKEVIRTVEDIGFEYLVDNERTYKPTLWNVLGLRRIGMLMPSNWLQYRHTETNRPRQEYYRDNTFDTEDYFRTGVTSNRMQAINEGGRHLQIEGKKIVVPVSQRKDATCKLIDDVSLNVFWNSLLTERLMQTMTLPRGTQVGHGIERRSVIGDRTDYFERKYGLGMRWDEDNTRGDVRDTRTWRRDQREDVLEPMGQLWNTYSRSEIDMPERRDIYKTMPFTDVRNERLLHLNRRRLDQTNQMYSPYKENKWGRDIYDDMETQKYGYLPRTDKYERYDDRTWDRDTREHTHYYKRNIDERDYLYGKQMTLSPVEELMTKRSGEIFIQSMQQLMARIKLEKIALSMDDKRDTQYMLPELITTQGKIYERRTMDVQQVRDTIRNKVRELETVIESVLRRSNIPEDSDEVVRVIADILVERNDGDMNIWDKLYTEICNVMYGLKRDEIPPSDLSIATANLREPIYQDIIKELLYMIDSYRMKVRPYHVDELTTDGITVEDVDVDRLVTYMEPVDSDVTNLVDQQLLQTGRNNIEQLERKIVVRQERLNHQPFTMTYDLKATRNRRVVVRTFLAPLVDEDLRPLGLNENRLNFIQLDAFVKDLTVGKNIIRRSSRDITWTTRDVTSMSDIYQRVMTGRTVDGLVGANCRFPHRLLVPRGSVKGLPVQILVVVTPLKEEDRATRDFMVNPEELCGLGIAAMHLDRLPLDFPLDRTIVTQQQIPNILMKDFTIHHDDRMREIFY